MFDVLPDIIITCLDKVVVNPQITNSTTNQIIVYNGIIPEGKSLVITFDGGLKAEIDGKNVSSELFILKGKDFGNARFDLSSFADVETSFVLPSGRSCLKYLSSSGKFDFDSFDRATFYKLKVGEFDESWFDQVIFATPRKLRLNSHGKKPEWLHSGLICLMNCLREMLIYLFYQKILT